MRADPQRAEELRKIGPPFSFPAWAPRVWPNLNTLFAVCSGTFAIALPKVSVPVQLCEIIRSWKSGEVSDRTRCRYPDPWIRLLRMRPRNPPQPRRCHDLCHQHRKCRRIPGYSGRPDGRKHSSGSTCLYLVLVVLKFISML